MNTKNATRAQRMIICACTTGGPLSSRRRDGQPDSRGSISTEAAEQLPDRGLHIAIARIDGDPAFGRAAPIRDGAVEPSDDRLEHSGVERFVRTTAVASESHVEAWDEHD